jgi:hypothetical protein
MKLCPDLIDGRSDLPDAGRRMASELWALPSSIGGSLQKVSEF